MTSDVRQKCQDVDAKDAPFDPEDADEGDAGGMARARLGRESKAEGTQHGTARLRSYCLGPPL